MAVSIPCSRLSFLTRRSICNICSNCWNPSGSSRASVNKVVSVRCKSTAMLMLYHATPKGRLFAQSIRINRHDSFCQSWKTFSKNLPGFSVFQTQKLCASSGFEFVPPCRTADASPFMPATFVQKYALSHRYILTAAPISATYKYRSYCTPTRKDSDFDSGHFHNIKRDQLHLNSSVNQPQSKYVGTKAKVLKNKGQVKEKVEETVKEIHVVSQTST